MFFKEVRTFIDNSSLELKRLFWIRSSKLINNKDILIKIMINGYEKKIFLVYKTNLFKMMLKHTRIFLVYF